MEWPASSSSAGMGLRAARPPRGPTTRITRRLFSGRSRSDSTRAPRRVPARRSRSSAQPARFHTSRAEATASKQAAREPPTSQPSSSQKSSSRASLHRHAPVNGSRVRSQAPAGAGSPQARARIVAERA